MVWEQGTESEVSVELDAADEVQKRGAMADMGLTPAGWYHSHPIFETRPSQKDCENQRNYQALFRAGDPGGGAAEAPFVAAIVGPYDPSLPDERSSCSYFVVQQRQGDATPFELRVIAAPPSPPTVGDAAWMLRETAHAAGAAAPLDLNEQWRPFARIRGGGRTEGPPLTRVQKLRGALRAHLPAGDGAPATEAWLDALCSAATGQQPLPPVNPTDGNPSEAEASEEAYRPAVGGAGPPPEEAQQPDGVPGQPAGVTGCLPSVGASSDDGGGAFEDQPRIEDRAAAHPGTDQASEQEPTSQQQPPDTAEAENSESGIQKPGSLEPETHLPEAPMAGEGEGNQRGDGAGSTEEPLAVAPHPAALAHLPAVY